MPLGGFGGNDPILTTASLQTYILRGNIRFFLFPFNVKVKKTATGEVEEFSSVGGQNSILISWVVKHCQSVPAQDWENGRYITVWKGKEKLQEFRPTDNLKQSGTVVMTNRLYDCASFLA